MSIPFVKEFAFEYGKCQQVTPMVQRVIANNPGPFTYTGTGVYIIGDKNVCVIDPGPRNAEHIEALDKALKGRVVTHVLVTHHHLDHSPLAQPLADKFNCQVYGYSLPAKPSEAGEARFEAGHDLSFKPDEEIRGGYVIKGDGWTIEAIHTPGHTSNHLCFELKEENILFSGDHIMGWSTSVVSPPDGHMGDYLNSLEKIRERNYSAIWPTHGPVIEEVEEFLDAYIAHRHKREAQILSAIKDGDHVILDIVKHIYVGLNPRLFPAASHSVFAHIIYMCERGLLKCDTEIAGLKSHYSLV